MVAIIILNYNNPQITIDCFNSILKYNTYPCKYIVVDNASTDDSLERLDAFFKNKYGDIYRIYDDINNSHSILPIISLVKSHENLGYACGNNIGLRFVEKDNEIDYVMILNNDVLFIQDIIPKLIEFIQNKKDAAIVSPILLKKDGCSYDYNCARKNYSFKDLISFYRYHLYYPLFSKSFKKRISNMRILDINPNLLNQKYIEIELPSGSCMLAKKNTFKRIDYFDERTFLYFEENILHRKIQSINMMNYLLTSVKCIHLGAMTTRNTRYSSFQTRQLVKSAYIYGKYYNRLNVLKRIHFFCLFKLLIFKKMTVYYLKNLF